MTPAPSTIARLGGDEFAIIQTGSKNQREGAGKLATKILELITKPFELNGKDLSIGASIGIVMAPEHGEDPDTLLKMADLALYLKLPILYPFLAVAVGARVACEKTRG